MAFVLDNSPSERLNLKLISRGRFKAPFIPSAASIHGNSNHIVIGQQTGRVYTVLHEPAATNPHGVIVSQWNPLCDAAITVEEAQLKDEDGGVIQDATKPVPRIATLVCAAQVARLQLSQDETLLVSQSLAKCNSPAQLDVFDVSGLSLQTPLREPCWTLKWQPEDPQGTIIEAKVFAVDSKQYISVLSRHSFTVLDAETGAQVAALKNENITDSPIIGVSLYSQSSVVQIAIADSDGTIHFLEFQQDMLKALEFSHTPEFPDNNSESAKYSNADLYWISSTTLVAAFPPATAEDDEGDGMPIVFFFHVEFESKQITDSAIFEDEIASAKPWPCRSYFSYWKEEGVLFVGSSWSQIMWVLESPSGEVCDWTRCVLLDRSDQDSEELEVVQLSQRSLVDRPWNFIEEGDQQEVDKHQTLLGLAVSFCSTPSMIAPIHVLGSNTELDGKPSYTPGPVVLIPNSDGVVEMMSLVDATITEPNPVPGMHTADDAKLVVQVQRPPVASVSNRSQVDDSKPATGGLFGDKPATGSPFGDKKTEEKPVTGGLFGNKPVATGSLFGDKKTEEKPVATGSLFGDKKTEEKPATGGLFGDKPTTTQGGLFGDKPAATTGNLFGDKKTEEKPVTGGLFGNKPAATQGGLFGDKKTEEKPATGGLFGDKPSTTQGGLFGDKKTEEKPATGGLFGDKPTTTQGGLFGDKKTEEKPVTGGLFGDKKTEKKPATGGLFGDKPSTTQGGLFGDKPATTTGSLFGDKKTEEKPVTGGLFGNKPAATQGGLFGNKKSEEKPAATGSLFGDKKTEEKPATGGLFGDKKTKEKPASGGLFGDKKSEDKPVATTGGLFGDNKEKPASGGLFGDKKSVDKPAGTTKGLFGGKITNTPFGTLNVTKTESNPTDRVNVQQPHIDPVTAAKTRMHSVSKEPGDPQHSPEVVPFVKKPASRPNNAPSQADTEAMEELRRKCEALEQKVKVFEERERMREPPSLRQITLVSSPMKAIGGNLNKENNPTLSQVLDRTNHNKDDSAMAVLRVVAECVDEFESQVDNFGSDLEKRLVKWDAQDDNLVTALHRMQVNTEEFQDYCTRQASEEIARLKDDLSVFRRTYFNLEWQFQEAVSLTKEDEYVCALRDQPLPAEEAEQLQKMKKELDVLNGQYNEVSQAIRLREQAAQRQRKVALVVAKDTTGKVFEELLVENMKLKSKQTSSLSIMEQCSNVYKSVRDQYVALRQTTQQLEALDQMVEAASGGVPTAQFQGDNTKERKRGTKEPVVVNKASLVKPGSLLNSEQESGPSLVAKSDKLDDIVCSVFGQEFDNQDGVNGRSIPIATTYGTTKTVSSAPNVSSTGSAIRLPSRTLKATPLRQQRKALADALMSSVSAKKRVNQRSNMSASVLKQTSMLSPATPLGDSKTARPLFATPPVYKPVSVGTESESGHHDAGTKATFGEASTFAPTVAADASKNTESNTSETHKSDTDKVSEVNKDGKVDQTFGFGSLGGSLSENQKDGKSSITSKTNSDGIFGKGNNAKNVAAKEESGNQAPTTEGNTSTGTDYRSILVSFYEKHNKEKVASVDTTLQKFKGREEEMLRKLEAKYRTKIDRGNLQALPSNSTTSNNAATFGTPTSNKATSSTFGSGAFGNLGNTTSANSSVFGTPASTPTQPSATLGTSGPNYHGLLTAFYAKYNPSKVAEVNNTLAKYKGHESVLFGKLERKYNLPAGTVQSMTPQPASSPAAFGNSTPAAAATSTFGSTPSGFGSFGASSNNAFGAAATPSSNNAFGAAATPGSTNAFGAAATPGSNNAFGAAATPGSNNAFGAAATPGSNNAFGSSVNNTFGSATPNANNAFASSSGGGGGTNNVFGANQSTFGSQPAFGSTAFGASPQPSGFGTPQNTSSAPALGPQQLSELRTMIVNFYNKVQPSKAGVVDEFMQKYKGREKSLVLNLCKKYNVQPNVGFPGLPINSLPDAPAPARASPGTGSAFGSPAGFGAAGGNSFGNTGFAAAAASSPASGFGSSSGNAFGGNNSGNAFASTSGFGGATTSSNAFGSTSGGFGNSTGNSFGNNASSGSGFGSTTGTFGSGNSAGGGFGSFGGGSGAFGSSVPTFGGNSFSQMRG